MPFHTFVVRPEESFGGFVEFLVRGGVVVVVVAAVVESFGIVFVVASSSSFFVVVVVVASSSFVVVEIAWFDVVQEIVAFGLA